jgi:cysteinyl-tRNA synthetase
MLRLYNTMTRQVSEFTTLEEGKVGLFTCGPTVYDYAHIGNLRTYLFEDILKRVLLAEGYQLKHVMNVTDVGHLVSDADTGEDKMEKGARREGKSVWEIAEFYAQAFVRNIADLHILEPDIWCKATDHIGDMIGLVQAIEEKGYTYIIDDGVYFDTSKLKDYGKMARLDIDGLKAGARIDLVEGKRNITDFALWKFSPKDKKRQMEWDSPWGIGFPGWHIECTAMSMKYLGDEFDIHCGGIDHVPVHHTNEIAQAESVTGKTWVHWWLHGEFLVMSLEGDEESSAKMAKSAGTFVTLDGLIERGYDPLAYRYFCLNAHYRSPLTFSWEGLDGAANALDRLRTRVIELRESASGQGEVNTDYLDEFRKAIEDDLNMPRALAVVWGVLRDTNLSPADAYATILAMDPVLGFDVEEFEEEEVVVPDEVQALAHKREEARKQKDFATADQIRDQIQEMGYLIEDTAEGARIKRPKK